MESGGSIGKLKRNEQPLFRGESTGFVNLLLRQHVAKLAGTSRSISPERQGCGCRLRFHDTILHGNNTPVTTKTMTVAETLRHDGNSFAVRLDSPSPHGVWKDSRYISFGPAWLKPAADSFSGLLGPRRPTLGLKPEVIVLERESAYG